MSSDATIKALKEGNAIEEDLVKMMKEGLNIIADSMLEECRKRNAAVEDLGADLAKEAARPKASKAINGSAELANALNIAIKDYRKAADESYERYETAYDAGLAAFERQTEEWNTANSKHDEARENLSDLFAFANEMGKLNMPQLYETAVGIYKKELDNHQKVGEKLRAEWLRISESNEQNGKELDRFYKVFQKKDAVASERAKTFKRIAELAGLKLDTEGAGKALTYSA